MRLMYIDETYDGLDVGQVKAMLDFVEKNNINDVSWFDCNGLWVHIILDPKWRDYKLKIDYITIIESSSVEEFKDDLDKLEKTINNLRQ